MTQWAGFLGLTALLISLLLLLTRATQQLVESDPRFPPAGDRAEQRTDGPSETRIGEAPGGGSSSDGDVTKPPSADRPESDAGVEPTLSTLALVANVALTQGLVAVVVLAGVWYFEIPLRALGLAGDPAITGLSAVVAGVVLGVILWGGSETMTALSEAFGLGVDEGLRELLAPETAGGWLALFGLVLPLVAVSEELLFRAAAIGVPTAGFDTAPWALAVVSSVAFAFCHGIQGRAGVLVTGVLGLALAGAYVSTGSLLLVIVAHYVLNATEFLVQEGLGLDPFSR